MAFSRLGPEPRRRTITQEYPGGCIASVRYVWRDDTVAKVVPCDLSLRLSPPLYIPVYLCTYTSLTRYLCYDMIEDRLSLRCTDEWRDIITECRD